MRWRSWSVLAAVLLLAWTGLAAWQYRQYVHERELARRALARPAEAVMKALVGGLRSRQRLGYYQCQRLQDSLEDLAASQEVLATAIVTEDGQPWMTAGRTELLRGLSLVETGQFWDPEAFRYAVDFRIDASGGGGMGGGGGGMGGGGGGGRGWGRGAQSRASVAAVAPVRDGQRLIAVLLLDRSSTDETIRRARWIRAALALAGAAALACVAIAWIASMRLAEARGSARGLEVEARHLRDLGQAAAGLAHETRNPLGLIRGWTQRLTDSDRCTPEQRRQAQSVIEECDRLTSRINQFLEFAKPRRPSLAAVDVEPLVDELAALLEPDLDAKRLRLDKVGPLAGCRLSADREMLRQALFNLLGNAIHFSPERGCVEIRLVQGHNGSWRMEVADGGPGVAAEHVGSLFTPYFTTRPLGTGLGLAIVRRIAAGHGWEAGYSPRPGGGAIFWLDAMHGEEPTREVGARVSPAETG